MSKAGHYNMFTLDGRIFLYVHVTQKQLNSEGPPPILLHIPDISLSFLLFPYMSL